MATTVDIDRMITMLRGEAAHVELLKPPVHRRTGRRHGQPDRFTGPPQRRYQDDPKAPTREPDARQAGLLCASDAQRQILAGSKVDAGWSGRRAVAQHHQTRPGNLGPA